MTVREVVDSQLTAISDQNKVSFAGKVLQDVGFSMFDDPEGWNGITNTFGYKTWVRRSHPYFGCDKTIAQSRAGLPQAILFC